MATSEKLKKRASRLTGFLGLRRSTVGVLAFILRGLKEFGEPTRKALIMDLCPDQCKAGMFGLYYLIRDVLVSLAALGGAFLWQISPQTNLITAFVFGTIGTIGFAIFGRDVPLSGEKAD